MEGYSRTDLGSRQFLDFMEKERDPVVQRAEDITRRSPSEDQKLELRLGPPGEDCSYRSSPENTRVPSFHLQNEDEMQNPQKKLLQTDAANTAILNSSSAHKRTSPASVVGWPPVRSFRKSFGSGSSSKLATQSSDEGLIEGSKPAVRNQFIKINMDGVPIGRKIDISAYNNYENLSKAVDEFFKDLLPSDQKNGCDDEIKGGKDRTIKVATSILDENREYTLVYEDNEGDKMLVGDLPWPMFTSTVKRLRVTKTSELPMLQNGCKQGRIKLHELSK